MIKWEKSLTLRVSEAESGDVELSTFKSQAGRQGSKGVMKIGKILSPWNFPSHTSWVGRGVGEGVVGFVNG